MDGRKRMELIGQYPDTPEVIGRPAEPSFYPVQMR